jgi:hypothetical protein
MEADYLSRMLIGAEPKQDRGSTMICLMTAE